MIERDEALRILAEAALRPAVEEVATHRARGRVLAETVRADRDFPPTDRSGMDGYAVRAADLEQAGRALRLVGEVRAGVPVGELRVGKGEAVRILTGAIVPPGADAVVMLERAREDSALGTVTIDDRPGPSQHIRRRGEEMRRGDRILEPGSPIHAPEIAALTSVGVTRVRVYRRPEVRILSTGDEIVGAHDEPADHQVRNSNSPTLLAQLEELGIEGMDLGIAPDTRERLGELIREGLRGDLFLLTGGVSVGKYDLVAEALAAAGMELLFHKVSIKPGKPVLAGRCGGCLVVGLPGNPVSAYTGFAVFVAPMLRRSMGFRNWANLPVRAVLDRPLRQAPGRPTYHLARVEPSGRGFVARAVGSRGSGDLLSMARANGFVITPADATELKPGTELPALLWRDFRYR